METQLPPPPPPPQPRKTGLIIGIVAGILALCLCIAVIAGVYVYRDQIPVISSFFPTPTPNGIPYVNSTLGIRVNYPYNWYMYDDESGMVIFANSEAAVTAETQNVVDGFVAIIRDPDVNAAMYYGVDTSTPESMINSLVDLGTANLPDFSLIDRQDGLTISGYPAASVVYGYFGDSFRQVNNIVVIQSGDVPTTLLFTTSEEYYDIHQPQFDAILNSLIFTD